MNKIFFHLVILGTLVFMMGGTGVAYADGTKNATLTVQAHDKDGWIDYGHIWIASPKTKKTPAQRILIKTLQKTGGDRDTLKINLAKATLSGGSAIAPIIGMNALDASLEVLVEEGVITEDEMNLLRGAHSLISGLQGATDAENILDTAKTLNTTYKGLVQANVIKGGKGVDVDRIQLKAGKHILNLMVDSQKRKPDTKN